MITSMQVLEGVNKNTETIKEQPRTSIQELWHKHLGHPGWDKARAIVRKLGDKLAIEVDPDTAITCEQCIWSKSTVARMGKGSSERACTPLDLIDIDLIINASHVTEHTCMLVLVNDHSKYVYAQPLLRKDQVFMQLKRVFAFLETQLGRTLKAIRSDQGTEW